MTTDTLLAAIAMAAKAGGKRSQSHPKRGASTLAETELTAGYKETPRQDFDGLCATSPVIVELR